MFENFVEAKTEKTAKWKVVFGSTSVVIHLVAIVALIIRGYWVIEKLPVPNTEAVLASAPPPPPPPPPGGKKKTEKKKKKKKPKPTETVQPTKDQKKPEPDDSEDEPNEDGQEGGVEGGVAGGVVGGVLGGVHGGVLGGSGPPGPPPPKQAAQVVPQRALEALRIGGNKNILPGKTSLTALVKGGHSTVIATVKVCLTAGGTVSSVQFLKKSGDKPYDAKIKSEIRRSWKYRPFKVNGKAVPVCTPVTFRTKIK